MTQQARITPGSNYTVQTGDSLWAIAVRAYGNGADWPTIYEANKAEIGNNPNLIYPGQVFHIPPATTHPSNPTPPSKPTTPDKPTDPGFGIYPPDYGDHVDQQPTPPNPDAKDTDKDGNILDKIEDHVEQGIKKLGESI